MPAPISDERAKAFAQALVASGGNRAQAAASLGYPSKWAKERGMALVRNPKVQKYLQTELYQQLQSLTPKAVATLEALLSNKSAYIRLDAAKDILNRNGISAQHDRISSQPLSAIINLDVPKPPETSESSATTIIENADLARTMDLD
jgi:phage terminase small subunit